MSSDVNDNTQGCNYNNYYMNTYIKANTNMDMMNNLTKSSMMGESNQRMFSNQEYNNINYNNNNMHQSNHKTHMSSTFPVMTNYFSNNQYENGPYSYYHPDSIPNQNLIQIGTRTIHTPINNNHQVNMCKDSENEKYNKISMQNSSTPIKKSQNPMNINIAVNNYYTSAVYNYYCFRNGQSYPQKYNNKNNQ